MNKSESAQVRETFRGTCEYCDFETTVTHFPRIALNVCPDCYRVHRDAIERDERS